MIKIIPSHRLKTILIIALLTLVLGLATIRVCADGGAMGSAYRTCDCSGLEWQLYDKTESDGPRRTICLGWVSSMTCYQFMSGPVVACSPR